MMRLSKSSIFVVCVISLNLLVNDVFNQAILNPDSLEKFIYSEVDDTVKINKIILLAKEYAKSDPPKALDLAINARKLSSKLGYIPGIIDAYSQMSSIYKITGNLDSAKNIITRAIDLSESIKDKKRIADNISFMGTLVFRLESPEQAKSYFVKSLSIYHQLSDSVGIVNSLNRIAMVYRQEAKYDSVVYYLLQCIRISENIDFTEGLGSAYVNLGIAYYELKEFKKARSYLLKSIEINKLMNNLQLLSIAYNNLGSIADDEQDNTQALSYYTQALEICEKLGNLSGIANLKNNIGNIYEEEDQYQKAFDNYTTAKSIYAKIGNREGYLAAYKNQGWIYYHWENYERALNIFDTCLILAREINSPYRIGEIYLNFYKTYESREDFKKAYYYKTLHSKITDSIFNLEKSEAIANLQLKYEKEKDQSKILFLQNENLVKDLAIRKRTNQRNGYLSAGSGIILIISFFFIFYRHKTIKDKIITNQKILQLEEEKKLMAARAIVEGQEEERKRIAKELHDGLGVLLATAKMQFSSIKDKSPGNRSLIERATKLLEQASGDVRKISHNMMPGLLTKFGFFEAVEDLFENLDETEGLTAKVKIEGEPTRLPENKEIMLYRVIQEMVNNTLKHAEAKNIKLMIGVQPDNLNINYQDDGKGFDMEEKLTLKSIGLTSIQSRVKFINGDIFIKSQPGEGVTYDISVPLP